MTVAARRNGIPGQSRATAWTVAWGQLGFAGLYGLCGYLTLAHAAELTGHWYLPGGEDPFDGLADVPAGSSGWYFAGFLLMLGPLFAGLGLVVTAVVFLLGYGGESRALTVALLSAAAVSVLILVVSLTPAAQAVASWPLG